jgi:hypothetical protein
MERIGVLGSGDVGRVLAAGFASLGKVETGTFSHAFKALHK